MMRSKETVSCLGIAALLLGCGGAGGQGDGDTSSTAGQTSSGSTPESGSSAEGGTGDGTETGTGTGPGTASGDASADETTVATDPTTGGDPPPGSCGDPPVWCPTPGTAWQWQLSGALDTRIDVDMFDIDLFDNDARQISSLQAQGRVVVCYFSAGSHEDWRPDAADFPPAAIGEPLDGWPGERWLDVRDATVRSVLAARLDLAMEKGCDAVEPDNVDGYANETGFPLTADDQLDFNRWLADSAHERGLSIGLKNDLDQVEALLEHFDWALNEECMAYDECDRLAPFIDAGKAVFHVEYVDDPAQGPDLAAQVCPDALARSFSTLIKGWDLDAWRIACE